MLDSGEIAIPDLKRQSNWSASPPINQTQPIERRRDGKTKKPSIARWKAHL